MAETFVNVTEGVGKKLHAYDRGIGANTVLEEAVYPAEFPYATYTVVAAGVSVATTSDHILQLMAGSSLLVRIKRIYVVQSGLVTAADSLPIIVSRLTTAGTGGTGITPAAYDSADAAAGATARSLPTVLGTVGTEMFRRRIVLTQTYATSSAIAPFFEWVHLPDTKPIIIPAGTANGLALRVGAGRAGATVDVHVEFIETNFV